MLNKKLKGDYEFVTTPLGVILFVGVILALVIFLQTSMLKLSADMKVSLTDIQAVDAAHLIKECFGTNMDGSIPVSYLESKNGGSLHTLCNMSSVDSGARIDILEGTTKTYNFGYNEKASSHKIFVTVNDGDKNYVARLRVSISEKASIPLNYPGFWGF